MIQISTANYTYKKWNCVQIMEDGDWLRLTHGEK